MDSRDKVLNFSRKKIINELKTFDLIIKYLTFFVVISNEHNFTYV